jgi:hypothetical protein
LKNRLTALASQTINSDTRWFDIFVAFLDFQKDSKFQADILCIVLESLNHSFASNCFDEFICSCVELIFYGTGVDIKGIAHPCSSHLNILKVIIEASELRAHGLNLVASAASMITKHVATAVAASHTAVTLASTECRSTEAPKSTITIDALFDAYQSFEKQLPSLKSAYPNFNTCFVFLRNAFAYSFVSQTESLIISGSPIELVLQNSALVGKIVEILRVDIILSSFTYCLSEQLLLSPSKIEQFGSRLICLCSMFLKNVITSSSSAVRTVQSKKASKHYRRHAQAPHVTSVL